MARVIRSILFSRWLRVQGGDVSIVPLLLLLAVAIALSWFNRQRDEVTPLPDTTVFTACTSHTRINCVVDGDTIWAEGEKIRLADIDAPEIYSPDCAWEKHMGEQASQRLATLLNEGEVALKASGSRERDKYGRLLRVATVNGRPVADRLIAEGLAYRWGEPNRGWCS